MIGNNEESRILKNFYTFSLYIDHAFVVFHSRVLVLYAIDASILLRAPKSMQELSLYPTPVLPWIRPQAESFPISFHLEFLQIMICTS